MSEALRLFGSRAIVTDASNGIGEAIVRTFVKQGGSVFAVDKPDSGIETQFKSLRGVTPYAASVTDEDSAIEMIRQANEVLKGLDVVVNNSMMRSTTVISDDDESGLEQFLGPKIRLYAATSRQAMPFLEKSPAGRIINMGFTRSSFSRNGDIAYERSQKVIAELTQTLAVEAGPYGTTVNYVQPGAVMTPSSRRIFADDKGLRDYCIKRSAANRLGDPVDIAKVVLFLASDDAVFVSGTGVVVDGGRVSDPQ
jgi:NAD(P)-dependent dehydrogenase (short-subunit alcohol dehydrogenase family)